ncbi:ABC transporter permease [Marinomonas balearica]|uniref:NitT/TauT family transport system permease protein n=1 Tax=Marinomonas balearica TaxID=491947 RepID=A0A4V3CGY3_9GAMM|nr:ABC transporter permease [Marinomonas balearica]TDO99512.1 NitT/TauT family transport system permease protein [Marinomonas balearica]
MKRLTHPLSIDSLKNSQPAALLLVLIALTILWYLAAFWLNSDLLIKGYERRGMTWDVSRLISDAYSMKRPLLPTPDQIGYELYKSIFETKISSKRSLVYHSGITLSSTLLGFLLGAFLGIVLAIGIVHSRTLERSLMPWVITSQTIPILAIAPMIIVVLGAMNFTGILPKAIISMYLSFFPVTIGMVKGLRAPDTLHMELLATYSASPEQTFRKLRWPSAMPYLFASLKIAIAASLVGAIVGELPTGAQGGLGSRLLSGSYYGQTIQIWSALVVAAILGSVLVALVGYFEKRVNRRMGITG